MTRIERQVRFMIRAWPILDRIERGEEIVGTTLDLVPDGATRLPLPLAVNLLAGGMRARWRRRTPAWILVRRMRNGALALGVAVFVGVVWVAITVLIILSLDPSAVLTSSCPSNQTPRPESCSSPLPPGDFWLRFMIALLAMAAIGTLLIRRRRRRSRGGVSPRVPTSN